MTSYSCYWTIEPTPASLHQSVTSLCSHRHCENHFTVVVELKPGIVQVQALAVAVWQGTDRQTHRQP